MKGHLMKQTQFARRTIVAALATCVNSFVAADAWCDSGPASIGSEAHDPVASVDQRPLQPVTAPAKPHGSGVVLRYLVPPAIRVGQSVTVTLYFSNVKADDGAHVVVRTIEPRNQLASFFVQKGEERILDLPMLMTTDGTQYLAVATTQAGRTSVQTVAIRVGSGKVKMKSQGTRRITPAGETVTSLPATGR